MRRHVQFRENRFVELWSNLKRFQLPASDSLVTTITWHWRMKETSDEKCTSYAEYDRWSFTGQFHRILWTWTFSRCHYHNIIGGRLTISGLYEWCVRIRKGRINTQRKLASLVQSSVSVYFQCTWSATSENRNDVPKSSTEPSARTMSERIWTHLNLFIMSCNFLFFLLNSFLSYHIRYIRLWLLLFILILALPAAHSHRHTMYHIVYMHNAWQRQDTRYV